METMEEIGMIARMGAESDMKLYRNTIEKSLREVAAELRRQANVIERSLDDEGISLKDKAMKAQHGILWMVPNLQLGQIMECVVCYELARQRLDSLAAKEPAE